jgi:hypothetical protein
VNWIPGGRKIGDHLAGFGVGVSGPLGTFCCPSAGIRPWPGAGLRQCRFLIIFPFSKSACGPKLTGLKKLLFSVFLLSIFSGTRGFCQERRCEDSVLNLGTVDSSWTYRNRQLGIEFPLPQGWYMFDYVAMERKYLRVGSDFGKMSSVLFDDGPFSGVMMTLADIKKLNFAYAQTILSLAKLPDSANLVLSSGEARNNTVSFRIHYADSSDANAFLQGFYKQITRQTRELPVLFDKKIGDISCRCFTINMSVPGGGEQPNLLCAHYLGCTQLLIRITYPSEAGLAIILDACGALRLQAGK